MRKRRQKVIKLGEIPMVPSEEKSWKEEQDEQLKLRFAIKPLNKTQEKYINAILTNVITFGFGFPGTGRTYLACNIASKLLVEKRIEKIVICRPAVECGNSVGFLPGSLEEKLGPYLAPVLDCLELFLGEKDVEKLIKEEKIILSSVGLLRGKSFRNSMIILDEAQNTTFAQLYLMLTRIGENCRLCINGDFGQCDLQYNRNDFEEMIAKLQPLKDEIGFIHFSKDDVVRSNIVRKIVQLLG